MMIIQQSLAHGFALIVQLARLHQAGDERLLLFGQCVTHKTMFNNYWRMSSASNLSAIRLRARCPI